MTRIHFPGQEYTLNLTILVVYETLSRTHFLKKKLSGFGYIIPKDK